MPLILEVYFVFFKFKRIIILNKPYENVGNLRLWIITILNHELTNSDEFLGFGLDDFGFLSHFFEEKINRNMLFLIIIWYQTFDIALNLYVDWRFFFLFHFITTHNHQFTFILTIHRNLSLRFFPILQSIITDGSFLAGGFLFINVWIFSFFLVSFVILA